MSSGRLLIVDDEPDLLAGLRRLAETELGCEVLCAATGPEALDLLENTPCRLVLADIRMPGMDGMELLERILARHPDTDVILMTAYGTIDQAVEALRMGAADFVTKPLQHTHLFHTMRRCLERRSLIRRNRELEARLHRCEAAAAFVGSSPALKQALSVMERVADSSVTVLITGESGTGKELAARTIHRLSSRGGRDMVAVNCAALPEAVLESELFGHCRGAFTGADQDHPGLFAAAHGSTLFLDEIGEMPLALQAKLLRVLQEREIRPIGSTESRKIDVRILASTNRDLKAAIQEGDFREDLYFRLSEISLSMPPLRAMRDDIPLLLNHFLEHYSAEFGHPVRKIGNEALRAACQAPWPGNVRQLQNAIKRAILLGGEEIQAADLELAEDRCLCTDTDMETLASLDYRTAKESILKKFSTAYFGRLLERHQGNVSASARACGLERQSLQQMLKKYGISADQYRCAE